jgi:HlyD family secretion protein
MEKNRKKKIILFTAVTFLSLIFMISFTSCMLLGGSRTTASSTSTTETTTFTVKIGNIIQSVSATGYVDSSETKTYSNQVSGEVLKVLSVGTSFKKDDVLLQIKDNETPLLISQSEINLKTAENSIKEAKLNYQKALDANHIAVQLAQLDAEQSEQATQNALTSLENANAAADASINSAILSAENAEATANASLKNAKIALDSAQSNYDTVKSDPLSTPNDIYQAKLKRRTAQVAYDQATIQLQNNASSAEIEYEQAKASAQSQADSAEAAYQQALNNQAKGYWNNLSSAEAAQLQITLARNNIEKAEAQVELSKISLEIAKLNIGNNEIIAPFDGIVLSSDYNQGGTAKSDSVVSIISDTFIIKTSINETDINKIKIGQDVNITLDAFPDQHFQGKVTEKSLISENTSNVITFEVTIKPDDSANSSLLYGLSANLTIIEESAQNVLFVPTQAVYKQNGKQYVDIVTATTEKINSKNISQYTKQIEVTTGISNYNYIEIKSGLKEGDVIIASSTGKLNQSSTSGTGLTGGQGQTNTSTTEGTGQQNTSTTGRRSQTNTSTTGGTDQQNDQTTDSTNQKSNSSTESTS